MRELKCTRQDGFVKGHQWDIVEGWFTEIMKKNPTFSHLPYPQWYLAMKQERRKAIEVGGTDRILLYMIMLYKLLLYIHDFWTSNNHFRMDSCTLHTVFFKAATKMTTAICNFGELTLKCDQMCLSVWDACKYICFEHWNDPSLPPFFFCPSSLKQSRGAAPPWRSSLAVWWVPRRLCF